MIRTACGCTTHGPGPACPEGRALYAAMLQAFEHLFQEKAMIAQDERWSIAALSRLAYIDHLNGWQEGDVKIQRRAGWEMVFTRLGGQWIFQFGTKEDALLVDWLATRGYQHVVRVNSARPGDHLLGYYRTTEKSGQGGQSWCSGTGTRRSGRGNGLGNEMCFKNLDEAVGSKERLKRWLHSPPTSPFKRAFNHAHRSWSIPGCSYRLARR